MASRGRTSKREMQAMEFLRTAGTRIPAGFAKKAAAATQAMRQKTLAAGNARRKQGARLLGQLKGGATVAVKDPANQKTLDGLLRWHKAFARKKLPFPKAPVDVGGLIPGSVSGTIVPPFDFADSIPTLLANVSNPTLSVSANVNGRISASAVSSQDRGFNGGSEYARVGIFFHPMTEGTLTISSSPTYSFQWSTNSLNTSLVTSSGSVGLTIYGMDELGHILATAGALYESWQEDATGEINFDFRFDVQKSLSVSLSVSRSLIYLCFVEVDAHVVGMGWPGSLATAMASATVPSIGFSFIPQPVVMA